MKPKPKVKKKSFNLDSWLERSSKSFQKAAKRAEENSGFQEFDDGRYRARLIGLSVGPSQSSNRIQATLEWKFLSGEYKGKTYRSFNGLTGPDGAIDDDRLMYFLMDMKRLGYEVDPAEFSASDIKGLTKQIAKDKPEMAITLVSKGEYQNVRINGPAADAEDEDDEDDEDDDTPKKKKKRDDDDESEDGEDEDADEDEDVEDEEEDEKPKKKKKRQSEDDEDEESEDEEEEEEEDEKPKKKKKAARDDEDDEAEDDEDEDDEDEADDEEEDEDEHPKKKKKVAASEDDDQVAVVVGSIVKVKIKGKTEKCEVTEIFEDDQEVKVKTPAGKTVRIPADEILAVIDMPKKKRK